VYFAGDVDGSLEAILDILQTYNSPHCQLHLLSYGVGNITESDIEMAATFNGNSNYITKHSLKCRFCLSNDGEITFTYFCFIYINKYRLLF